MPPEILAFDHIHVFVQDRAAAQRWYASVMGLQPTRELAFWAVDGGPLTLQNASGTVHIALFERPLQPTRSTIALRVSGPAFRDWQAHLRSMAGLEVSEEDHQASVSLYFKDPDGNPYEITTYDRAAMPPAV